MGEFIDAMAGPGVPQPTRWDRGGSGTIATLDELLVKADLPDRLQPAKRLLDQGEELFAVARRVKEAAAEQRSEARQALRAADPEAAATAHARVVVETDPWLSDSAPAMLEVMSEGHHLQADAVQVTFGLVHGIYAELQGKAAEVVAEVARVGPLPAAMWVTTSTEQASTLAIRGGCEAQWVALVRLADRWSAVHNAAALIRESGQFAQQFAFLNGCPGRYGTHYLGWEAAEEQVPRIRRLPEPLQVTAMINAGLRPGLWLAADHVADRERAAKARPGLLQRLGVSPVSKAETKVEVG